MSLATMLAVRFPGDAADVEAMRHDAALGPLIAEHWRSSQPLAALTRRDQLTSAVRIDRHVLPDLDEAIDALTARLGLAQRVECYVYSLPEIQAYVTRAGDRFVVGLASATVEKLTPAELEFVIGHELGHVVYGHLDFPTGPMLEAFRSRSDVRLQPKHAVRLQVWSRKKEVSADRAGLVACGSLDVAASALFKTASGLALPQIRVTPLGLAQQFDELQAELLRDGSHDLGMLSHPLVPLRMRALALFWACQRVKEFVPTAPGELTPEECDRETAALLAHMDPLSERGGAAVDPLLVPFLLWGGLFVAEASGGIDRSEHETLASFVGRREVQEALAGEKSLTYFRTRLQAALADRRFPICALDIDRVFTCVAAVALADGDVHDRERRALYDLANHFGVAPAYVDGLLDAR